MTFINQVKLCHLVFYKKVKVTVVDSYIEFDI